jgi:type II secretion system protein H
MHIRKSNERGITLTELMVVLAIIAVGAAIAVPTFVNIQPQAKVHAATRELISDLRYTRQLAVTANTRHRIVFTSSSTYQVQRDTSNSWTSYEMVKTVDLTQIASGVYWTSTDEDKVFFVPNGGVDTLAGRNNNVTAAEPLVLTLTHTDTGQYRHVNVNLLGRAWTD